MGAVAPDDVGPALRSFLAARLVTYEAVVEALTEQRRHGRPGISALAAALESISIQGKPSDSELESVMAALFAAHQLPPFTFHAIVEGFEVDFLITGTTVILETDGWEWHGLDRDQFEADRARDAVLREAGYIVQRFTWRQITQRPAWVAERIRGTLRRWAPGVLAS
jgi:very-short-patch-repair endonuclease